MISFDSNVSSNSSFTVLTLRYHMYLNLSSISSIARLIPLIFHYQNLRRELPFHDLLILSGSQRSFSCRLYVYRFTFVLTTLVKTPKSVSVLNLIVPNAFELTIYSG
jgi:hypothetical protein